MVEVLVEFDYDAEQEDELTIRVGDIIKNVIMSEGGWWEGELNGKKGMFPDNFVKVKNNEPEKPKEDPKKDLLKHQQRSSVKELANKLGVIGPSAPQKKRDSQFIKKKAKVLFDYEPTENEDELKIDEGQIVEITKQEEDGWWEGTIDGKTGVFPSNFVEIIEETDPEQADKAPPADSGIKGKKIMGVGLGNIFQGGPIKLRTTQGTQKTIEKENKMEEVPAPVAKREKSNPPSYCVPNLTTQLPMKDTMSVNTQRILNSIDTADTVSPVTYISPSPLDHHTNDSNINDSVNWILNMYDEDSDIVEVKELNKYTRSTPHYYDDRSKETLRSSQTVDLHQRKIVSEDDLIEYDSLLDDSNKENISANFFHNDEGIKSVLSSFTSHPCADILNTADFGQNTNNSAVDVHKLRVEDEIMQENDFDTMEGRVNNDIYAQSHASKTAAHTGFPECYFEKMATRIDEPKVEQSNLFSRLKKLKKFLYPRKKVYTEEKLSRRDGKFREHSNGVEDFYEEKTAQQNNKNQMSDSNILLHPHRENIGNLEDGTPIQTLRKMLDANVDKCHSAPSLGVSSLQKRRPGEFSQCRRPLRPLALENLNAVDWGKSPYMPKTQDSSVATSPESVGETHGNGMKEVEQEKTSVEKSIGVEDYCRNRSQSKSTCAKGGYLSSLNQSTHLSPFLKAIANRYHLFDKKESESVTENPQVPDTRADKSQKLNSSSIDWSDSSKIKLDQGTGQKLDLKYPVEDNPYFCMMLDRSEDISEACEKPSSLQQGQDHMEDDVDQMEDEKHDLKDFIESVINDAKTDVHSESSLRTNINTGSPHLESYYKKQTCSYHLAEVSTGSELTPDEILEFDECENAYNESDYRRNLSDEVEAYNESGYRRNLSEIEVCDKSDHRGNLSDEIEVFGESDYRRHPSDEIQAYDESNYSYEVNIYKDGPFRKTDDDFEYEGIENSVDFVCQNQEKRDNTSDDSPFSSSPVAGSHDVFNLSFTEDKIDAGKCEKVNKLWVSPMKNINSQFKISTEKETVDYKNGKTETDISTGVIGKFYPQYHSYQPWKDNKKNIEKVDAVTSPISELLSYDTTLEDSQYFISPEITPAKLRVKPRYSSSPVLPADSQAETIESDLKGIETSISTMDKNCVLTPLTTCSGNIETKLGDSRGKVTDFDACDKKSTVLDTSYEFVKNCTEKRKKRFSLRSLFKRKRRNKMPLILLSYRRYETEVDTSDELPKSDPHKQSFPDLQLYSGGGNLSQNTSALNDHRETMVCRKSKWSFTDFDVVQSTVEAFFSERENIEQPKSEIQKRSLEEFEDVAQESDSRIVIEKLLNLSTQCEYDSGSDNQTKEDFVSPDSLFNLAWNAYHSIISSGNNCSQDLTKSEDSVSVSDENEIEIFPDSPNLMLSMIKDVQKLNLTLTPTTSDAEISRNLDSFLREALKPIDNLSLQVDSSDSEEDENRGYITLLDPSGKEDFCLSEDMPVCTQEERYPSYTYYSQRTHHLPNETEQLNVDSIQMNINESVEVTSGVTTDYESFASPKELLEADCQKSDTHEEDSLEGNATESYVYINNEKYPKYSFYTLPAVKEEVVQEDLFANDQIKSPVLDNTLESIGHTKDTEVKQELITIENLSKHGRKNESLDSTIDSEKFYTDVETDYSMTFGSQKYVDNEESAQDSTFERFYTDDDFNDTDNIDDVIYL